MASGDLKRLLVFGRGVERRAGLVLGGMSWGMCYDLVRACSFLGGLCDLA